MSLDRTPTPAQWRVVVQLWTLENNYTQAAENLGISVQAVKMHVQNIAAWLDGHGPPAWKVLRKAEEIIEAGYEQGYDTQNAA